MKGCVSFEVSVRAREGASVPASLRLLARAFNRPSVRQDITQEDVKLAAAVAQSESAERDGKICGFVRLVSVGGGGGGGVAAATGAAAAPAGGFSLGRLDKYVACENTLKSVHA